MTQACKGAGYHDKDYLLRKYYEIGDTYLAVPAKYKSIVNILQGALNKNGLKEGPLEAYVY